MSTAAAFRLLRPKQWTKNVLVFGAWIFTAGFHSAEATRLVWLAFGSLCALSSATYALNDVLDAPKDRQHPRKRNRPVASGALSPGAATALGAACAAVGIALGAMVGPQFYGPLALFIGVQIAYNLFAKRVAVLDVFTIGFAFVLRAALGAIALSVRISPWLLFCTCALALLIGFAKRRQELNALGSAGTTREALGSYTLAGLNIFVAVSAAIAALSYGLYALESETARANPSLLVTVPFVLYGIFRYLLLIFSTPDGEEPETLLTRDPHLVLSLIGFTATSLAVMAGWKIPLLEAGR